MRGSLCESYRQNTWYWNKKHMRVVHSKDFHKSAPAYHTSIERNEGIDWDSAKIIANRRRKKGAFILGIKAFTLQNLYEAIKIFEKQLEKFTRNKDDSENLCRQWE